MLGLRSQFALSNILVAHMRQNQHFAYVQDDIRVNDALTLNVGLRYEYSVNPATVVRGGYGTAYMHFQRAGSGNILPINGPQVVNVLESQTDPLPPAFRTTPEGYPAGATDPANTSPTRGPAASRTITASRPAWRRAAAGSSS